MEEKGAKPKWQTALETLGRAGRRRRERQEAHEPVIYRLNSVNNEGNSYFDDVCRSSDDPAFQHEAKFEEESLLGMIDSLTDKQRMVVILHYFNELSFTEIGAMMGISRQCARRICVRAQGSLKKNITKIL